MAGGENIANGAEVDARDRARMGRVDQIELDVARGHIPEHRGFLAVAPLSETIPTQSSWTLIAKQACRGPFSHLSKHVFLTSRK